MLLTAFNFWDDWQLYHKVTFDGPNKLIIVNNGVSDINVEQDLYSDWKEWTLIRDYSKYDNAMRVIGGDPTVAGDFAGSTFFVTNGWQIYVDHAVNFDGNMFSDDFASPFVTPENTHILSQKFTNLVDKVTPDTSTLGTAVWQVTSDSGDTYASTLTTVLNNTNNMTTQGVSLTAAQTTMLEELYRIMGLDPTRPLIATASTRTAGASVTQTVTGNPETGPVTVTRI